MKKINNRWVDENNNSWCALLNTEEQAKAKSGTLVNCRGCIGCIDCIDCSDCRGCIGCRDCSDCRGCIGCRDCIDCRGCSDFKENPQRVTSHKLGEDSRNTTIYFNYSVSQVVTGCFRGDIEEFKKAIKEKHGDNEYAVKYMEWLDNVEPYIEAMRATEARDEK